MEEMGGGWMEGRRTPKRIKVGKRKEMGESDYTLSKDKIA